MIKLKALSECRLLTFTKEHLDFSTRDVRWSIEHGRCFVNGSAERFSSRKLKKGDQITIWPTKRPHFVKEEERVLYEDERCLIYNKPPHIASSDLASILNLHLVHRLDRDTSGVMLFAKKDKKHFESLFRERKVQKTYHALVQGIPTKKKGAISFKMGPVGRREGAVIWGKSPKGAPSHTDWSVERVGNGCSLLRCHPLTGRTHQIRVHLRALGHSILGDAEYGPRQGVPGLFRPLLHASGIAFEAIQVSAPLPEPFFLEIFGL